MSIQPIRNGAHSSGEGAESEASGEKYRSWYGRGEEGEGRRKGVM